MSRETRRRFDPLTLIRGLPGHPLRVLTAGGGFVMLSLWLKHGGMQQSELPGNRIRPARILGHFALAAAGQVIWIIYVAADTAALAWMALALLVIVALIGFSVLAIWLRQRSCQPAAAGAGASARDATPAERHFPTAIVAAHGVLAATTLVLVLLVVARVGGS